jgi:putative spermidine/putrescine transport system permease protein
MSIATSTSSWLHRHRRSRLALLLSAPMLWLVVAYLGSLAVMFVSAFWSTDSFTGALVKHFTMDNFHILITESVYRTIAIRSLVVASLVTIVDAILAMPIAFFMAKVLSPRYRRVTVALVLLPLWASYLECSLGLLRRSGFILLASAWARPQLFLPTSGFLT